MKTRPPHPQVREDAAMMKLGPTLRWVPGYFNESLPRLAREEPSLSFLTIRLDGDAYWSTRGSRQVRTTDCV